MATFADLISLVVADGSGKKVEPEIIEHTRRIRTQMLLQMIEVINIILYEDIGELPTDLSDQKANQAFFSAAYQKVTKTNVAKLKLLAAFKAGGLPDPEAAGLILASDNVLKSLMHMGENLKGAMMGIMLKPQT